MSHYSFYCKLCGDYKYGTKEEIAEYRKHHRIKIEPKDSHLMAVRTGEKPIVRMCPVEQVIDIENRAITWARPELAKILNKQKRELWKQKQKEKKGAG